MSSQTSIINIEVNDVEVDVVINNIEVVIGNFEIDLVID
ncbi:hypothetical protein LINGRAHAP2_LOCUS17992 [Linum grandiflorum]